MGELLQECIKKTKKELNTGNFEFHIQHLGKICGPYQEDVDTVELHYLPYNKNYNVTYKKSWCRKREYIRIAEKLRDFEETYKQKSAKTLQEKEKLF